MRVDLRSLLLMQKPMPWSTLRRGQECVNFRTPIENEGSSQGREGGTADIGKAMDIYGAEVKDNWVTPVKALRPGRQGQGLSGRDRKRSGRDGQGIVTEKALPSWQNRRNLAIQWGRHDAWLSEPWVPTR